MHIDGRHCETEESQVRNANMAACKRLLARLREYHGRPQAPQPQPDIVDLVPIVVRMPETAETKADTRFMRYLADENGRKMPTVQEIKHVVATRFKVTSLNLDSRSRKAAFVLPRQIAVYLCRELTVRSLPDIARRFGGRDHTTALHSINKIEDMIAKDPAMAKTISELREQLQNDPTAHDRNAPEAPSVASPGPASESIDRCGEAPQHSQGRDGGDAEGCQPSPVEA